MLSVKEVILVEGRYDKNTLSQIVHATIIETSGFGIFNNTEKRSLLRLLAEKQGLIILTDSDGAGFVIRNFIKGIIDPKYIKNAYIPDIPGKEKRKSSPSKEGKLGVEGMEPEIIIAALQRAGATFSDQSEPSAKDSITKADLYALGLSGAAQSAEKRRRLQKHLGLPELMTANALLEALNIISSRAEIEELLKHDL